jgi:hypothetical protein
LGGAGTPVGNSSPGTGRAGRRRPGGRTDRRRAAALRPSPIRAVRASPAGRNRWTRRRPVAGGAP